MGDLDKRGDLAAAEIAFYSISLLLGIAVVFRQGMSWGSSWLYVCALSILRIVGSTCLIYIEVKNDQSTSLFETAGITSAVGTAPLLSVLLGILARLNDGIRVNGLGRGREGIPQVFFRVFHFVPVVALVLAIIGGIDETHFSDLSKVQRGKHLMEAASIIFAIAFLVMAAVTVLTLTRRAQVFRHERKLLYAALASLPFLVVRIAYTVITSFSNKGSKFYFISPNVYVEAFMLFAMEGIIILLFVVAGLVAPKHIKQVVDYNSEPKPQVQQRES